MLRSYFDFIIILAAIAFLNFGSIFFFSKKDLVLEKIPSAAITKSTRSLVLSSNLIRILSFNSETSLIFFQILNVVCKYFLLKIQLKLIFAKLYILLLHY